MHFFTRTGPILSAVTRRDTRDVLRCPVSDAHTVRMEWEIRDGMRTGKLVPWCYNCRQCIPDEAPPVTFTQREREGEPRQRFKKGARVFEVEQSPEVRQRNTDIRMAWARGMKPHVIAMQFSISRQRVQQIVHGRLKTA
jgi:hypothetical protein